SSAPPRDTIQFQLGVQGTANTLTLYLSRLPSELNHSRDEILSDLRLISYWLATDGSNPLGLARREFKRVTADDASNQPSTTDIPQDAAALIAEEVKDLRFRYFDGLTWYDTWDATEPGPDGVTAIGPPLLIEITLGFVIPTSDNHGGPPTVRSYRHVVSIPTAD